MIKLLIFCLFGVICISESKIVSSNEIKDDVYIEKILGKFMYLFDQSLDLFNKFTRSNTTSEEVIKIIRKVDDVYRFLVEDYYLPDEMMSNVNSSGRVKRQENGGYSFGQYVTPVVDKLKNMYITVQKKVGETVSTLLKHVFSEKVDKARKKK